MGRVLQKGGHWYAVTIQTNFAGQSLDPAGINGTTVYLPARITYHDGNQLWHIGYTDYGRSRKWVPGIAGKEAAKGWRIPLHSRGRLILVKATVRYLTTARNGPKTGRVERL